MGTWLRAEEPFVRKPNHGFRHSIMLFEPNAKVLVAHRRLFPEDSDRLFFGELLAYEDGIAKVRGRTFLPDPYRGGYQRKDEVRTKLVSVTSGSVLVYELPATLQLENLRVETQGIFTRIADGAGFFLDLTEHMSMADCEAGPGQLGRQRKAG